MAVPKDTRWSREQLDDSPVRSQAEGLAGPRPAASTAACRWLSQSDRPFARLVAKAAPKSAHQSQISAPDLRALAEPSAEGCDRRASASSPPTRRTISARTCEGEGHSSGAAQVRRNDPEASAHARPAEASTKPPKTATTAMKMCPCLRIRRLLSFYLSTPGQAYLRGVYALDDSD